MKTLLASIALALSFSSLAEVNYVCRMGGTIQNQKKVGILKKKWRTTHERNEQLCWTGKTYLIGVDRMGATSAECGAKVADLDVKIRVQTTQISAFDLEFSVIATSADDLDPNSDEAVLFDEIIPLGQSVSVDESLSFIMTESNRKRSVLTKVSVHCQKEAI